MLEAIGGLTLVFGGGWLLILFMQSKENTKESKKQLIKESWTCQDLIYDYRKSVKEGKPFMTNKELEIKLNEIISRPEELAEIERYKEEKRIRAEQIKEQAKRNRIFGYKHENQIFEIFHTSRELPKKFLIAAIKDRYHLSEEESKKIWKLWRKHELIKKCPWNKKKWEVGYILNRENSNLDKDDLTRTKWLEQKGLQLIPHSPEYNSWI